MSGPTTVNQVASVVNEILKGLIEGAGETAIETALIAQNPWLGLPFIKQLFEFILGKVGDVIYQNAALAATKIVVDVQVNMEKSAVYAAFQTLQMAIASEDKDAIKKASADLDTAYASLIHYDGSASP